MNKPDSIVVPNYLEACREFQSIVDFADGPEQKAAAARDALALLQTFPPQYLGAQELHVHTYAAYAFPDGMTQESDVWPVVKYPEMWMSGHLGRTRYLAYREIATLAWMICDSEVVIDMGKETLDDAMPGQEPYLDQSEFGEVTLLAERRHRRPLYLPVNMIETVVAAA